MLDSFIT